MQTERIMQTPVCMIPAVCMIGEEEGGSDAEVGLEGAFLEALLDGDEEAGGVRAVDDAVVVGQREVDHRPDRDRLAAVGVRDDDWPLDDAACSEDRHLRLVDDRRVEERAAAAGVRQRERPAAELVRGDLVAAGGGPAGGELARLAGGVW